MHQLHIKMHGLPVILSLLSNGMIGFSRQGTFKPIFDYNNNVIITDEAILVFDETIMYNVALTMSGKVKEYLTWLDLECPWGN